MSLDVAWASREEGGIARATTLGAGGLFVRVDAAPPEGAPIRVRFRVPGSPVLHELDGRVAWVLSPDEAGSHAPGMGIAFGDPQQIARLAEALEREADSAPEEAC